MMTRSATFYDRARSLARERGIPFADAAALLRSRAAIARQRRKAACVPQGLQKMPDAANPPRWQSWGDNY